MAFRRQSSQTGSPRWAKFTPRQDQVFDYRYIVHDLRLNGWVIAYRRIFGEALLDWEGPEEARLECPPAGRESRYSLDYNRKIEGLKPRRRGDIVPDAGLEVAVEVSDRPVY